MLKLLFLFLVFLVFYFFLVMSLISGADSACDDVLF